LIVTCKPRKDASTKERRFARTRRTKDHEQPGWESVAQAAQGVERLDDRRVAPEEDAGVLRLERP
jgi:hypothetical protein